MLESYKLLRKNSHSSPVKEMRREKQLQIESLYEMAADREEGVLLNGTLFAQSPRIFGFKKKDDVHSIITVETVNLKDRFEVGDYIEYSGGHWLCMNASVFHDMYCIGTFQLCNWCLYWIDMNKRVKSVYCIDLNSTQYNSGESSNKLLTLGSAQHMLYMQCNEDTVLIDSPIRICLDKNKVNPTFYKVTQNDNSTYNYGKGLCCVTVTETPDNKELNKMITLANGGQVWVSDYAVSLPEKPVISDESKNIVGILDGVSLLKIGYSRKYSVIFTDKEGVEIPDVTFEWNIDNEEYVQKVAHGKSLELVSVNEEFIGNSFLLQVIVNNIVLVEKKITIVEGF